MEMPEGWKRLCDDIPYKLEDVPGYSDNQWFLWNTADLIKEMAEALEYSNQLSQTLLENSGDYGKTILEDQNGKFIKSIKVLKKFKEWK